MVVDEAAVSHWLALAEWLVVGGGDVPERVLQRHAKLRRQVLIGAERFQPFVREVPLLPILQCAYSD